MLVLLQVGGKKYYLGICEYCIRNEARSLLEHEHVSIVPEMWQVVYLSICEYCARNVASGLPEYM
jgi:hypothetical protein